LRSVERVEKSVLEVREIQIGDCVLDVVQNQLKMPSGMKLLEPRLTRLLVVLAEAKGGAVSRDILLDAVSSMPFSGDEALTQAISKLRQVLGDAAKEPRYIKTIPRQGYALIAQVQFLDQKPDTDDMPQAEMAISQTNPVKFDRMLLLVMAVIILVLVAVLARYFWWEYGLEREIEFISQEEMPQTPKP